MKTRAKVAVALAFAALLCACEDTYKGSETIEEPAVVVMLAYSPAQHGHSSGWAFTGQGGPVVGSVDVPASYAVVFECAHGRFIVQGKKTWNKVHQGDKVVVKYREIYRVRRDGRTTFEDFDFLDVRPAPTGGVP